MPRTRIECGVVLFVDTGLGPGPRQNDGARDLPDDDGQISSRFSRAQARCRPRHAQKSPRRKTNFANGFRLVGVVRPLLPQDFTSVFQKNMIVCAHPAPAGGAYRDRHGRWGRDAVDAAALRGEQC
jgi:hypothetical protein